MSENKMRDLRELEGTLRNRAQAVSVKVAGRVVELITDLSFDAAHHVARTHAGLERDCVATVHVPMGSAQLNTRYYSNGRVVRDITDADE